MGPIFALSLRALLTGRRWLLVVVLVGLFVLLTVILAVAGSGDRQQQLVDLYIELVLPFMLPFIALLFATEALGAEVEDRTITYLTLRPLSALAIVLPKFAATALVTLLATELALLVGFFVLDAGHPALLAPLLVTTALGGLGYCALFLFLGLVQRRSLLTGAIYILLWEGAIGALSTGAAHLSVRFYSLGVFADLLNRPDLFPSNQATPAGAGSVVFLAAVTVLVVAQTAYRLRRVELR